MRLFVDTLTCAPQSPPIVCCSQNTEWHNSTLWKTLQQTATPALHAMCPFFDMYHKSLEWCMATLSICLLHDNPDLTTSFHGLSLFQCKVNLCMLVERTVHHRFCSSFTCIGRTDGTVYCKWQRPWPDCRASHQERSWCEPSSQGEAYLSVRCLKCWRLPLASESLVSCLHSAVCQFSWSPSHSRLHSNFV